MAARISHVKKILAKHPNLEIVEENSERPKVRCKLTGHELPCQPAAIDTYIRGKKYQRLCGSEPKEVAIKDEWRKFLDVSVKRRNQYYCKLTKRYLNNLPHHIERHFAGKRFQKALEKYDSSDDLPGEPGVKDPSKTDTIVQDIWVPPDVESDHDEDYVPDLEGFEGSEDEKGVADDMEMESDGLETSESKKELKSDTKSVKKANKRKTMNESESTKTKKPKKAKDSEKRTPKKKNTTKLPKRKSPKRRTDKKC
ncbi:predicted protein [Nematostella vectensis]|uniref:Surfeit locus protein 2 n=1 Tax=Nematostella vectensis TaxID=45351 RepID=A7RYV9_NEMVE|nr:surfeit locus protein 2 [Nematostella vectensis]EDO43393.1 predicted protein [Nematostella vectensis]|eukprot:XP_001635456.1 predicted protein [Nematostella vectensis]